MTRILTGFVWDGKTGGIDAYLTAFARVAFARGVQLDFLTNDYSADFAAELEAMGHGLFEIATLHDRVSQRATIARLQQERGYDAAYLNVSTALMYPVVKDASDAGIPLVAVHSHAAGNDQVNRVKLTLFDAANHILAGPMRKAADLKLACSKDAAAWLFGAAAVREGEVRVVPNPVDTRRCAFNEQTRAAKRVELGVGERPVVGSVTAMKEVKNPFFLVDVFAELLKLEPRAVFVAVGDGELSGQVAAYAAEKLPADSYMLLGKRGDVSELLQAFDAFVLPSRKEGLSIAAIEAQSAGLSCLLSSGVPEEAIAAPQLAHRMPLAAGASAWAKALQNLLAVDAVEAGSNEARCVPRGEGAALVEAAGYSLTAPELAVDAILASCGNQNLLHQASSEVFEL